jgi:hypothetical protein
VKPLPIRKLDNTPKFFLETGLLWKINSDILHPLGLALEVEVSDEGEVKFGDAWDYREDAEGILYGDEDYSKGKARWEQFKKAFADKKLNDRKRALGFVVQLREEKDGERIEFK